MVLEPNGVPGAPSADQCYEVLRRCDELLENVTKSYEESSKSETPLTIIVFHVFDPGHDVLRRVTKNPKEACYEVLRRVTKKSSQH